MSEMLFCYSCRMHHPKERMRRFSTRVGPRWRCVSSIEAAAREVPERDSFGRQQTAANREISRRMAESAARLRELQLLDR